MGRANIYRVAWNELKDKGWGRGKPLTSSTCLFGSNQDHERQQCEERHVGGMRATALGASMPFWCAPHQGDTNEIKITQNMLSLIRVKQKSLFKVKLHTYLLGQVLYGF